MSPPVQLERRGAVLTATLDRPRRLNAYDTEMRDALFEALELASADPSVAVFVVRGNGRAFSSGGDLAEFGTAPSPLRARDVRRMRDLWGTWSRLPCVSIAAVHGIAAGGGFEMALLCDLVVCADDARMWLPETALGLLPGVGGTQTLSRAVGPGRAAAVLLAGREIGAAEALRLGIATEVVPARALRRRVGRLADALASRPRGALRAAKAAVARGADLPLERALGLERRLALGLGRSQP
ncbi:MAG: enoyl-CoA hydratase/isomerase family protein [Alphaproteobacteria bacterium]